MDNSTFDLDSEHDVKLDIDDVLKKLPHHPCGPIYSNLHKMKGMSCLKNGHELQAIYHLSESHAPSLRTRTSIRYDLSCITVNDLTDNQIAHTLQKTFIDFDCQSTDQVFQMLNKIAEMPKQWTLVEMTAYHPTYSVRPHEELQSITPSMYISVFDCGQQDTKPFCVRIDQPGIKSNKLEIAQQMQELLVYNTSSYKSSNEQPKNISESIDSQLKEIVANIEYKWLGVWRTLFLGKFKENEQVNEMCAALDLILTKIRQQFVEHVDDRLCQILRHFALGTSFLRESELSNALHKLVPGHDELINHLIQELRNFSRKFMRILRKENRHPVILIIDQQLDVFPWEVCDCLAEYPVCRLPSLHFVYGLFKEHEPNIKNGVITITNPINGSYVVNPSLNLPKMEQRMSMFYKSFLPEWYGTIGVRPTCDQFKQLLLSSNIFAYSGHGCGTQFLSGNEIQKMRVKAIVMLFGCQSVALEPTGGRSELSGPYQNYLIACSPLVVGNLYNVSDFDMDLISAQLLTLCVPSKRTIRWTDVDKNQWTKNKICYSKASQTTISDQITNVHLLDAIVQSRRAAQRFLTGASLVARGLPIAMEPQQ